MIVFIETWIITLVNYFTLPEGSGDYISQKEETRINIFI